MANFNGDSKPKSLAFDAENCTDIPTDVFQTSEDEMAILNIASKMCFTNNYTWNTSFPPTSRIFLWPVCPTACTGSLPSTIGDSRYSVKYNTFLSYITNFGRLWRGGITYTIKIVATPFHSGSLLIEFIPSIRSGEVDSLRVKDYNYRQIVDVRDTTEVTFTIPYTWNNPWKPTNGIPQLGDENAQTYNVPTGHIYVTVLNQLRAPSTAADHVDILLFSGAAPDFQLAIPEIRGGSFLHPDTARSTIHALQTPVPSIRQNLNAQSGNFYPSPTDSSLTPNQKTVGEVFLSLRQLLKRFHRFDPHVLPDQTFFPFSERSLGGFANEQQVQETTLSPWVESLFRYKSGSLKLLARQSWDGFLESRIDAGPNAHFSTPADQVTRPVVWTPGILEPLVEFHIPFYQRWPAIPTGIGAPRFSDDENLNLIVPSFRDVPYNRGTSVSLGMGTDPSTTVLRAIGEDFSFGYLLGPPQTFTRWPDLPPPSIGERPVFRAP